MPPHIISDMTLYKLHVSFPLVRSFKDICNNGLGVKIVIIYDNMTYLSSEWRQCGQNIKAEAEDNGTRPKLRCTVALTVASGLRQIFHFDCGRGHNVKTEDKL